MFKPIVIQGRVPDGRHPARLRTTQLSEIFRGLHIAREDSYARSGRNEPTNTVALLLDHSALRRPKASERLKSIALVHEARVGAAGHLRDDLAFAYSEHSHVRAIVSGGPDGAEWQVLPNIGRVVELDEDAGTYRVVFFNQALGA